MHPSSSVAQILARLNRNSEEPVPYVPGCTSVLKVGASNCANEEVKVKPNGILLLYIVIGEMDIHMFACYIGISQMWRK